jgi:signal transduction histidine kinase
LERVRDAGQPVRLEVTGEPFALSTAVDHAVYRMVQEALTNTHKHAAGATATVAVSYQPGAIEIWVNDDGPAVKDASPKYTAGGSGFGLTGMVERIALCGGGLQVGPTPEGGFRVHAHIPVDQSAGSR